MKAKRRLAQLEGRTTSKAGGHVNPYMTMPLNDFLAVCVNALREPMPENMRRVIVDGVKKIKAVLHGNE